MESSEKSGFIDLIYHFKGQWDVPSQCGIRIVKKDNCTIIIATELYDTNTGTSVTKWNVNIVLQLCEEHRLEPQKIIFIEHTPDRGSKLDFYNETFFRVNMDWNGTKFVHPVWQQLSREEVENLISN